MTPVLVAEGIGRIFSGADGPIVALQPVDLSFKRGEMVAVKGPSGGGKSTLLNLLGLLDRPSSGQIQIDGSRVDNRSDRGLAEERRRHIGFLFQDAGLIDRMTALDNVRLPLDYRNLEGAFAHHRARLALEGVGLTARVNALVDTLSGGERQRVGLARLVATKPAIIICDEPTASLDEANSRLVIEKLRDAASNGACVICASHDPIVLSACDTALELDRGIVVNPGH